MKKRWFLVGLFCLFWPFFVMAQDTITIVAVGDVMLGTIFPKVSDLADEATSEAFFSEVKPYFEDADIVFCNMEGVFADSLVKECKMFCFGMPSTYVKYYMDAGFNLISVGNNHSNDFRTYGRENTAKILDQNQLHWAGYQSKPKTMFTLNGVRYGFCAFSPNSYIASLHDYKNVKAIVQELDSLCDVVIVSMHCGGEGTAYQHVTRKADYYIEQNRGNAYEFAHMVIDAGADVVLGHGPHVTRGVEVYDDRFIAYSMGNFATYSQIKTHGRLGIAPIFRIRMDGKTGAFIDAQIIPTYQPQPNTGPKVDTAMQAIKIIQELSAVDFKDNPPSVSDEGIVTKTSH
ncbi:MAG: CapA family protein [Bacteroidales bacterium]|nr:CapA family protein [Bacteroidales bacterium]